MNFVIKSKKKAKKIKRNKFSKKYNKKKNKSRKLKRGGVGRIDNFFSNIGSNIGDYGRKLFSSRYEGHTFINTIDDEIREKVEYSLNDNINKLEIDKRKKILCELFSIFYKIYGNIIKNPNLRLILYKGNEDDISIEPTLTILLHTGEVLLNAEDNKNIDTIYFSTLTNIIKIFYKTIFDLGFIQYEIKDIEENKSTQTIAQREWDQKWRLAISNEIKYFFKDLCSTTKFIESTQVTSEILIELIAGLYKEFTYKDKGNYSNIEESKYNIFFKNPVINKSDSKLYEMSDLYENEYIYSNSIMEFRGKLNEILINLNNPNSFPDFRSRTKPYGMR